MSRIIESCGQCKWMKEELTIDKLIVTCKRTDKHVFIDAIPESCPLPKLEDKMREAYGAGYAEGKEPCILNKRQAYEEWRKQNG